MSNYMHVEDYDDYKYIFVETTANCNLRCTYCYYHKEEKLPEYPIEDLVQSFSRIGKLIVCFLGGEPFKNSRYMEQIMSDETLNRNQMLYASVTNGTQFRNMDPEFLGRFTFHHLSTDGVGEHHDEFRGKGVYDQVIDNIKYLRKYSDAGVVARMTISSPDQILDIPEMSKHFDAVYWQLNNTRTQLSDTFIAKYNENLGTLFQYWKEHLYDMKHFTIAPFIGMCHLILTGGMEKPDLICGAGSKNLNISISGDVYPCPESSHRLSEKERIGTVDDFDFKPYPLKNRCLECDIVKFCGGRCAMTDDDLYCDGVKELYRLSADYIAGLDAQETEKLKELIDYQKGLAYTAEIIP
ncbi:Anaerobic sulfatase-maturating enzyme [compost metagenome]